MTASSRPRGRSRRLPRRVYWVRRLVVLTVLVVVVGVVYGVGSSLAGSLGGGSGRQVAVPTSAEAAVGPSPSAATSALEPSPSAEPTPAEPEHSRSRPARTKLPDPEGVCADSDVTVAPRVRGARLGEPIRIVLGVGTRTTPACTWEVSADSVFLKVSQEREDSAEVVWSSQECPGLMPTAQVVARRVQPAEIVVSWSGQRSDPECSRLPGWVHAGSYRATSVARGAVTPREADFTIAPAKPEIVVLPSPEPSGEADDGPTDKRTDNPTDEPTGEPIGR